MRIDEDYKYEGAWGTPTTTPRYTMPSNNFRELKTWLRKVCKGNLQSGQNGWVEIWHKKKGPSPNPIYSLYYAEVKN